LEKDVDVKGYRDFLETGVKYQMYHALFLNDFGRSFNFMAESVKSSFIFNCRFGVYAFPFSIYSIWGDQVELDQVLF